MVVTDNNNNDTATASTGAYIDTTTLATPANKSSSTSSSSNNIAVATDIVAEKFKLFVESSFSASSKEEVEAAIEEVFSPSLVIVAGGEERDLDFFKRTVVSAAKAPLTSRVNFAESLNDTQIRANWSLYVAGIQLFTVDRLITIDSDVEDANDAKIVRFEPFEGKTDLYTRVKQFFGLVKKDDIDIRVVAEKYSALVESTADGKSPSDVEAMIDDVFAPSFVLVAENTERDLAYYKQTCVLAASSGFSAKVDKVDIVDSEHIQISYDLYINGELKEELKSHRLITAKDGKIVQMEPNSGEDNDAYFARVRQYLPEE
jgi:hypothetical protein